MPVTWCYDVEDGQRFCNPGFPIGCYITDKGRAKDACVISVSLWQTMLFEILFFGRRVRFSPRQKLLCSSIEYNSDVLKYNYWDLKPKPD